MGSHYESNLMTHFVADAAALGWDLGQLVFVCMCVGVFHLVRV